jgi:1,4-alpha-glucan branching enzyme
MQNVSNDFVSSLFSPNRYSAKKMAKPVNFVCNAPQARQVTLLGEFNNWNPESHPMERRPDGAWVLQLQLHHGHHQYRFMVDGQPELDPKASGVARDPKGQRASLIAVS